jgi:hypothetical protein
MNEFLNRIPRLVGASTGLSCQLLQPKKAQKGGALFSILLSEEGKMILTSIELAPSLTIEDEVDKITSIYWITYPHYFGIPGVRLDRRAPSPSDDAITGAFSEFAAAGPMSAEGKLTVLGALRTRMAGAGECIAVARGQNCICLTALGDVDNKQTLTVIACIRIPKSQ